MESVSIYIVYIIHFVVHEDSFIDWGHIISNEIFDIKVRMQKQNLEVVV